MLTTGVQTGKRRADLGVLIPGVLIPSDRRTGIGYAEPVVDFDKPLPLWYWILMVAVLFSLIRAIASGLNHDIPMSRTSRFIRVVLGSLWAVMIVLGMALNIWKAYR
jgi:hypothetical protein